MTSQPLLLKKEASSCYQTTTMALDLGQPALRHERTSTMQTPEPKRSKTTQVETSATSWALSERAVPLCVAYPSRISVPSKKIIKVLYEAAIEDLEAEQTKSSSSKDDNAGSCLNDQQYLKRAGLLSFEQVLIPSIALQQENALKRVQAKVQRDAPDYTFVIQNCRRLVRTSAAQAIRAVQIARTDRFAIQQDRRMAEAVTRQQDREARQRAEQEERKRQEEERTLQKELRRKDNRMHKKRNLARNQEICKEVIFLTSSIAQLEREERMWIQMEQDMIRLHPAIPAKNVDDGGKVDKDGGVVVRAPKNKMHRQVDQKVQDIVSASRRIEKGLGMILKLLEESEVVRKDLYSKYRSDHMFHGYQAVDNPKGMIRFLSQSQDDS
jgi:hypothetical protein